MLASKFYTLIFAFIYCFYKIDHQVKEITRTAIIVSAVHDLGAIFAMILWEFDWSKHFREDSCSKVKFVIIAPIAVSEWPLTLHDSRSGWIHININYGY